jgi:hypothetical protein
MYACGKRGLVREVTGVWSRIGRRPVPRPVGAGTGWDSILDPNGFGLSEDGSRAARDKEEG